MVDCSHPQGRPTSEELRDQPEAIIRVCAGCNDLLFWHGEWHNGWWVSFMREGYTARHRLTDHQDA